jgi:hypothetical protein
VERILSLPAKLLAGFHGLFPDATADLLALVNRLMLPAADGAVPDTERGQEVWERVKNPLQTTLTSLGVSAAERLQ